MEADEIIQLAQSIKNQYGSSNPFYICKNMGIKIEFTNLKPTIYQAYTVVALKTIIKVNSHFTLKSQKVLCAHELGHALLHRDRVINQFNDNYNGIYEYEANLFAVALLFNQNDLCIDISQMNNYLLKGLLDMNIKTVTNEN